jgi:hypothetical protein
MGDVGAMTRKVSIVDAMTVIAQGRRTHRESAQRLGVETRYDELVAGSSVRTTRIAIRPRWPRVSNGMGSSQRIATPLEISRNSPTDAGVSGEISMPGCEGLCACGDGWKVNGEQ